VISAMTKTYGTAPSGASRPPLEPPLIVVAT
jgi:hypothetical protein